MQVQTLDELKAENAKAENEVTEQSVSEVEETQVEAAEETNTESEMVAEPEQNEDDSDTVESWMQTEGDTSDDDELLTDSDAANIRRKWKGKLKKAVEEKDSEIEKLRAENEQLKSGAVNTVSQELKAPTLESCDYDEEVFQKKMVEYTESLVTKQLQTHATTEQQKYVQEQAAKVRKSAIDSHYERAAKLQNITPEQFQSSDLEVRKVIASVSHFGEKLADNITDDLISHLGEGSEKLMFYLGRNKKAQSRLREALESDASGLKAGILLGEMKKTVMEPVKKTSNAPKPSAKANGDGSGMGVSNFKRKYEKAKSAQEKFKIRQEAKKAGENVRDW
jgi:hypothetical protein